MITVTRFNHSKVTVNAMLIETVEETPDTVITLTTGKKILVLESAYEISRQVQEFIRPIGWVQAAVKNQDTEGLR